MRYTIEYDKQFIKSGSGFTPCWLAGDNNVWEPTFKGKERRARSWSVFWNLLGVSEQDILDEVKATLGGYNQHWQKNGKWVDDEGLIRWIRNGCKNAATIEDILAANRRRAVRCYISSWEGHDSSTLLDEWISTTEQLDKWITVFKKVRAGLAAKGTSCYPVIAFDEEKLVHPRAATAKMPEKVLLRRGSGRSTCYLSKYESGRGHEWAYDIKKAMVLDYEEAEKLKKEDLSDWMRKATIVSADAKDAPYNAVIQFTDGSRAGSYVLKRTKNRLYTTSFVNRAHHYRDEASAKAALKKLQGPFQHVGNMVVKVLEEEGVAV